MFSKGEYKSCKPRQVCRNYNFLVWKDFHLKQLLVAREQKCSCVITVKHPGIRKKKKAM